MHITAGSGEELHKKKQNWIILNQTLHYLSISRNLISCQMLLEKTMAVIKVNFLFGIELVFIKKIMIFFFLTVLGFELRAYTTSPFLVASFFGIGSRELFA
jgi:hypothetical protein